MLITKLINKFKIRKYKRSIKSLENKIIIFEIPYDLAIARIQFLEQEIEALKNETIH